MYLEGKEKEKKNVLDYIRPGLYGWGTCQTALPEEAPPKNKTKTVVQRGIKPTFWHTIQQACIKMAENKRDWRARYNQTTTQIFLNTDLQR